jgi:type VI secretion system protein ImpG
VRDELLGYYERELVWLRQASAEFATRYPKLAGRLQLEATRTEDPHVERLIESFALLAARLHLKLDDEFPQITQALLNVVYPHYVRPVPSFTIVEYGIDPSRTHVTSAQAVPRGTMMLSRPVAGLPCKFRSCYDTTVWPLSVVGAQWTTPDRLDPPLKAPDAQAALKVDLECWPDVYFESLDLHSLRFCLHAEPNVAHALYELILNNCREIVVRDPEPRFRSRVLTLEGREICPVGFEPDEALIPYPRRSLQAYRLLQEYFAFPEKYFFLDLKGLEPLRWSGFQRKLQIIFLISRFERADRHELLESGVTASTFRLGCTPAVNCFPQLAEPIQLDQARFEYPVVADARRPEGLEIFSIEEVRRTSEATRETEPVEPLFSFRHAARSGRQGIFWQASRVPQPGSTDGATEMLLTLADLTGQPLRAALDTLTVSTLCTNGDLPSKLPFGNEAGDFDFESASAIDRIVALRKPSPALRPPLGGAMLWRLVSHLSLNYLSLVEDGVESLREILRLYQDISQPHMQQQVDGLLEVRSARRFARVSSEHGVAFARGTRVEMMLDEERFVGGGAYLFSAVMERFLAEFAALNSFTELSVSTRQRKEVMREWKPRSGDRILL